MQSQSLASGPQAAASPMRVEVSREHLGTSTAGCGDPSRIAHGATRVGKYLVSPLIKALENGLFASSVSIRSGSGSATTDRVLRLTGIFRCATEAAIQAHAEALRWIADARAPWLAPLY